MKDVQTQSVHEKESNRIVQNTSPGKICNISTSLDEALEELPITDLLRDESFLECLSNSFDSHHNVSYTVNNLPGDGMIRTEGNIESGNQYLLNATYRLYYANQKIAEIYWSQEKDSDSNKWKLDIEIISDDTAIADSIFTCIRRQLQTQKDKDKDLYSYHR